MSAVDQRINSCVRDFLIANRPAAVPGTVAIRAAQDREKVERPYAYTSCEDGETPHRKLRKVTFVLATRTHEDGEDGPDENAEMNQKLVDVLAANTAELKAALAVQGLKLLKFVPGAGGDEAEESRGRRYFQRWGMWVELIVPVPAEG